MSTRRPNEDTASSEETIPRNDLSERPDEIVEHAVTIATKFSGPIPHPQILEAYERILPGSADRLITAFENQYKHRMLLEDRTNKSQLFQSGAGQVMGGLTVFCCLGITAWMGFLGHDTLAGVIATTTVVSLATIYFLGKRADDSHEKSRKST